MCVNCREDVMDDGHGELIHELTMKYGCFPGTKAKEYKHAENDAFPDRRPHS
jgi:hypothetical protein